MTKQDTEPMGWLHPSLNLHRAWQGRRVLRWRTQLFLAALFGLCIFAIWKDKPLFLIFSVLAFFAPLAIAPKSLQKKQSLLEIEKNYGQAYTTALVINHNNFGFGKRLQQQAEAIQKQAQLPSLPVAEMLLALALVALVFALPKQNNIQTAQELNAQALPTETQTKSSKPQTTNTQNQTINTNPEQPQNFGKKETSKTQSDLQNTNTKTNSNPSEQSSGPQNSATNQKNKKTSSANSPLDSQTNDAKNNTENNSSNNQSTESLSRDFLQQQAKNSAQNKKPNGDDGQNKQSGNTTSSSGQNKNSEKNNGGNNTANKNAGNNAEKPTNKTAQQKQAEQQKRNAQENPQQAPSSGQEKSNGQTPISNPQKNSAEKNSAQQNNKTSQNPRERNLGEKNEDASAKQISDSGGINNPNTTPGKPATAGQNSAGSIAAKPSSGSTKIERLPGQIGNGAASSGNTELPGNAAAFEASPNSQVFKRAAEDAILDPRLPPEYQELLRRYYK